MTPPLRSLFSAALLVAAAGWTAGCANTGHTRPPRSQPATPADVGPREAVAPPTTPASAAAAEPPPAPAAAPTRPVVNAPARGQGWRLALPAVGDGPSLHAAIEPGRRATLRIGNRPSNPAQPDAAQAQARAVEPAADAAPRSPRHAMLWFSAPGRASDGLVALVGHVSPNGDPAPGGFCVEIRGTDRYAFAHQAAEVALFASSGTPLPGGRNEPARNARVWPAADRGVTDADRSLLARFADSPSTGLDAWFRLEADDQLVTAARPATHGRPDLCVLALDRGEASTPRPFITVYTMPTPGAPQIQAVASRLENRGQTRVVTVTTDTAVHTLVQHLTGEPHITPDLSMDGRFAAVARTAEGTLIDAYLGDGNALVLPELTLDAQSAGVRSGYIRR